MPLAMNHTLPNAESGVVKRLLSPRDHAPETPSQQSIIPPQCVTTPSTQGDSSRILTDDTDTSVSSSVAQSVFPHAMVSPAAAASSQSVSNLISLFQDSPSTQPHAQVLSLLALLVQKYKY